MIDLLRRDPAVRSLPVWILLAILFGSMMEGVRTFEAFRAARTGGSLGDEAQMLVQSLGLWIPLVAFLFLGRVGQRCTRIDLTLPLAAKRLWSAHLTGVFLSGAILIAAGIVGFGLRRGLVSLLPNASSPPAMNVTGLLMPSAAVLAAAVVLIQAIDPSVYVLPPGPKRRLAIAGLLLAGPPLILALAMLPWFVAWLLLAVVGVLALRIHRSLPPGFTLVPRHAARRAAPVPERLTVTRQTLPAASGRGREWRTNFGVFRILCAGIAPGQLIEIPFYLVSIPLLLLWGMALAGFPLGDEIVFMWLTLTAYMLFAFLPAPMAQVAMLDPLPVSRRKLFALMILPSLAVVGAGYAGGNVALSFRSPIALIEYHDGGSRLFPSYRQKTPVIRVPLRFCKIGLAGRPARIESPWGESHPAWTHRLFRGAGITIYSPFTPGEEASPEFVALQISRAVEAVYGRSIPPEQIQALYLDPAPDGTFPLAAGARNLLEDFPGLEARGGGLRAPVVFLVVGWLFLILAAIYMRAFRATIGDGVRKGVIFGAAGMLVLVQLAMVALNISGIMDQRMPTAVLDILAWTGFGELPAGALLLWIVCLLMFLPVYLLVERAFHRVEAAPTSKVCGITNPV